MKVFTSRRDWVFSLIYLTITIVLFGSTIAAFFDDEFTWTSWVIMFFILGGINLIVLISFFFVKTKIENEELIVNIMINVFRINIFKITKVRIGETMWSGLHKYGTSTGGLIIFSKFRDDLYITPKDQDEFLKQLLEVNRHIIIEDLRK